MEQEWRKGNRPSRNGTYIVSDIYGAVSPMEYKDGQWFPLRVDEEINTALIDVWRELPMPPIDED